MERFILPAKPINHIVAGKTQATAIPARPRALCNRKGRMSKRVQVAILAALCIGAATIVVALRQPSLPRSGSLLLNEVSYHPDEGGAEFLEGHNPSGDGIDLSGWCFTDGIDGCFPEGTEIAGHGFATVRADSDGYDSDDADEPALFYKGRLANEGERVELRDVSGKSVFSCEYDDNDPWPVVADGSGNSLERIGTSLPCDDPRSWMASVDPSGATPGRANSINDPSIPSISSVAVPSNPAPGDKIPLVAEAKHASEAWVEYVVGSGPPKRLQLSKGAQGDDAGESWTGTIPSLGRAELLRYRVVAESASGQQTSEPLRDDSQPFRGILFSGGEGRDLPIVRAFLPEASREDLESSPEDRERVEVTIAIDSEVFDGSTISVKGSSSLNSPKKKYEVRLPRGYRTTSPGFDYPVDGFDLQAELDSMTPIVEKPAWRRFLSSEFRLFSPNSCD